MSTESSVIKEFLVALGFKTDEPALKKFDEGIQHATQSVLKLGAAIEATALAIAAGVTKAAANLESLYFASIKAGDSATNLKAFDRAAQNLGTTAGEALESVQGLARFMRENPGGEGLLASLGVQTRDVNGQLRGTTDMLLDLSRKFASMPYYLARQYGGFFGISEDTLRAMRSSGFEREVLRMRKQMENTGFDQASKDAHGFMMDLRDLITQIEAFGIQIYHALTRKLGGGMREFTQWLRENGPKLADRIVEVLFTIIDLAERLGRVIGWLVGKFIEWDKATDGLSTKILAFVAILKFFGAFEIVGGIWKLAGAFLALNSSVLAASASGTGLLAVLGPIAAAVAAIGAGYVVGKMLPESWRDTIGRWTAMGAGMLGSQDAKEAIAVNDPMTYLQLNGWTKAQAAGILANLQAESGMNPHAVGDKGKAYGLAQWHPDRQAAFEKWAGHNIRESTTAEQLDFVNYELRRGAERAAGALLAASRSARESGEVVARHYERPAAINQEAAKRGERAVQIAQETTIHVNGSNDPRATARETAEAQKRVNAELVRNFQVSVQ